MPKPSRFSLPPSWNLNRHCFPPLGGFPVAARRHRSGALAWVPDLHYVLQRRSGPTGGARLHRQHCHRYSAFVSQNRQNVLAFAKQTNHIEVIRSLQVKPNQWKAFDAPRPKALNFGQEPRTSRTDAGLLFNLLECQTGHVHQLMGNCCSSFGTVVTDFVSTVLLGQRAQVRWRHSMVPRAIASNSLWSASVGGWASPDARPSSTSARRRTMA